MMSCFRHLFEELSAQDNSRITPYFRQLFEDLRSHDKVRRQHALKEIGEMPTSTFVNLIEQTAASRDAIRSYSVVAYMVVGLPLLVVVLYCIRFQDLEGPLKDIMGIGSLLLTLALGIRWGSFHNRKNDEVCKAVAEAIDLQCHPQFVDTVLAVLYRKQEANKDCQIVDAQTCSIIMSL